jgi:2-methylisocitrate lyase-like PEP mutase family enzyme
MTTSTEIAAPADSAELAERFQQLHTDGILVLPNAWDVASARIAVQQGAVAVATTSAGVAWCRGSADGNVLTREQMLDNLSATVAAVDVPVTSDIESGFGATDDEVCDTVRAILAVGAVGINIEDRVGATLFPIEQQAARITAIRAAADEVGVRLFINARTDVYLAGSGDQAEAIDRGQAYAAAGASGVFVPGPADLDLIGALVAAIPAPLNIMVGPGSPSIGALAGVGVRRASSGAAIAQAIYRHTQRAMAEMLTAGTYQQMSDPIDYQELNALMS